MKAVLRNYRQSPRKVRLVADSVRGVSVKNAISILDNLNKKGALEMKKIINSAVANAKENFGKTGDDLFIKTLTVDEGRVLKRFIPRAFGRATPIHKRLSHIALELGSLTSEKEVKKENLPTGQAGLSADKAVKSVAKKMPAKATKKATTKTTRNPITTN